jgi:signal transduction histidine kinase
MLSSLSGWIGRLSIGQKLAASFGVMVLLLIVGSTITLTYLSRVNSYVDRYLRITVPGMIAASEMLQHVGEMQIAMHHVLEERIDSERSAGFLAMAKLESNTFTTLDFYRKTHAARTHPILYGMLQYHGRVDLSEQEEQVLLAIADGLTSLRDQRGRLVTGMSELLPAKAESAYEYMAAKTAGAITSLIEIHRKIDVEMKIEGDRLVDQARLIGMTVTMVLGFLILAVYLMMQRYVAIPLKRLAETANRVAHHDHTARFVSWASQDEVGVLAESLSTMLTSLHEHEAALMRKTKELESFSYTIAHDLKGPLREIEGFSSLLEKQFAGSGDQEKIHHIDVIRKSSLRLTHMIEGLLKYSRLEQQELPRIHFNVVEMIEGLVRDLQRQLAEAQPKITLNLPFAELYGEPISIRQALGNVLDNALKFSDRAAIPVIDIGGQETATERMIYVRDNGIGFDDSNQEKIFGLFERLHSPGEYEGTGVGLAIVKMVAEKHGGRVWAESSPSQGSTFYLAFPSGDVAAIRLASEGR